MLKSYRVEFNVAEAITNRTCDQVITGACFVVAVAARSEREAKLTGHNYLTSLYHEIDAEITCVEDCATPVAECNVIAPAPNFYQELVDMLSSAHDGYYDGVLNNQEAWLKVFQVIGRINAEIYGGSDNPNTEEHE